MANLERKNQKIFAGSATNNGQFGSLQTGAKVLTTDTDVIQALTAFLEGWNSAVISGEELPSLEEFQALNFLNTRQIKYLLDTGFPEWDSATEYFIGNLQREVGGTKLYKSITDNNIGNVLTGVGNWLPLVDLASATVPAASETVAGIAEIATQTETNTGTDDERFVTPLKFKTRIDAISLGIGQTWQDVTGSRSVNTTYTNTTGRPIVVVAGMTIGNTTTFTNLIVGGVNAWRQQGSGNGGYTYDMIAIVPDGVSYSISGGSPTKSSWRELR